MDYSKIMLQALLETLYMVSASTVLAVLIGFIPAIILVLTAEDGLSPNKFIYWIFDFTINILRSVPFVILMISIFPITKLIVGRSIGTTASIVPLTISAAPFAARVIEAALNEVDCGVIEAAKSFGATKKQIILKVMLKEALPSITLGITLTVISLIGYSAMAGAVGGGGLGDIAIKYGYYRFNVQIMIYTVIILILVVQIFQSIGNKIYRKMTK